MLKGTVVLDSFMTYSIPTGMERRDQQIFEFVQLLPGLGKIYASENDFFVISRLLLLHLSSPKCTYFLSAYLENT